MHERIAYEGDEAFHIEGRYADQLAPNRT